MPYTSTLTLRDSRFRQLQDNLKIYLNAIESHDTSLAESTHNIQAMERVVEDTKALYGDLECTLGKHGVSDYRLHDSYMLSALGHAKRALIEAPEEGLRLLRERQQQVGENKRQVSSRLANINEALSAYPEGYTGETVITKAEIAAQLRNLPNIDRRSIAIGDFPDGPILRYVMKDVICKTDRTEGRWNWIACAPGQTPSVFLQDVVVRVNLIDGTIKLAPKRGQRPLSPFEWTRRNRVHPHVLDNDQPCLGDFGGPLREAIANRDWATFGGVMKLFLETAITSDTAGSNWVEGLRDPLRRALDEVFPGGGLSFAMEAYTGLTATDYSDFTALFVRNDYNNYVAEQHAMRLNQVTPGVYELIIDDERVGTFSTHPQDSEFLFAFEYSDESTQTTNDDLDLAA